MAELRRSSAAEVATPEPVQEHDELLATKLNIPQIRLDRLGRYRLLDRLNQGIAQKLILVCTPAGFGKTTLLADWAASTTASVTWLSLDPQDNDPMRFWRYLVTALDRIYGGFAEQVRPLLTPPGVIGSEGVVTAIVNELQGVPRASVLILDDYHVIDSRPIQEGMARLIDNLPAQLRLVISSRSDPTLPLARLRGRGELAELRAAELRFTPEEISALLGEVGPSSHS